MQAGGVEFDNAVRQWLIAQVAQARWADTQSKENDASIGTSTGAVLWFVIERDIGLEKRLVLYFFLDVDLIDIFFTEKHITRKNEQIKRIVTINTTKYSNTQLLTLSSL